MKIVLVGAMCPTLCGYVFDKGFVVLGQMPNDPGLPAKCSGITICSRCKRWLGIFDNELRALTHPEVLRLAEQTRGALGEMDAITRHVESRLGKY